MEKQWLFCTAIPEAQTGHGWHHIMNDLDTSKQIAKIKPRDSDEVKALADATRNFDGDGETLAYLVYAFGIWRAKHKKQG